MAKRHVDRILAALASIYENDSLNAQERIQATRIAQEVLSKRAAPKRKTDKDRAIEAALLPKKKGPAKGQTQIPENGD